MKAFEKFFEAMLWNSRWAVLIIVIFGLLLAFGVLIVTTADALELIGFMLSSLNGGLTEEVRSSLRIEIISRVVGVVDGYLIAAILIIFPLGIYELFVGKIDQAEGSEFASRLLLIRSLDDLKDRLANMILLILIVKFFQQALNTKFSSALEVLYLSIGVVLIAAALFLSGRAKSAKDKSSDVKSSG